MKEPYSISMELLLVALGLLIMLVIVANYVDTTIALILAPFFIYFLWTYMQENSVSFF